MKKYFIILIFMLSIFSIANAHSEGIYKEYYDNGKILKESYFSNDKKIILHEVLQPQHLLDSLFTYNRISWMVIRLSSEHYCPNASYRP